MGRNAGGHAHGNAGATIQQQERQLGRQHRWFLLGAIEIGGEINGVVADFFEQGLVGEGGQPRFGVTHGGRGIVIHRAEVAVAIEQRMAAGKGLHLAHQGVVYRLVPMGVVLAEHIPHHPGAFAVGPIGGEPQFVHREKDPTLHGLEPIAHIGQGPTHDHAHRVFEIRALHLQMQGNRNDALVRHSAWLQGLKVRLSLQMTASCP